MGTDADNNELDQLLNELWTIERDLTDVKIPEVKTTTAAYATIGKTGKGEMLHMYPHLVPVCTYVHTYIHTCVLYIPGTYYVCSNAYHSYSTYVCT